MNATLDLYENKTKIMKAPNNETKIQKQTNLTSSAIQCSLDIMPMGDLIKVGVRK